MFCLFCLGIISVTVGLVNKFKFVISIVVSIVAFIQAFEIVISFCHNIYDLIVAEKLRLVSFNFNAVISVENFILGCFLVNPTRLSEAVFDCVFRDLVPNSDQNLDSFE